MVITLSRRSKTYRLATKEVKAHKLQVFFKKSRNVKEGMRGKTLDMMIYLVVLDNKPPLVLCMLSNHSHKSIAFPSPNLFRDTPSLVTKPWLPSLISSCLVTFTTTEQAFVPAHLSMLPLGVAFVPGPTASRASGGQGHFVPGGATNRDTPPGTKVPTLFVPVGNTNRD